MTRTWLLALLLVGGLSAASHPELNDEELRFISANSEFTLLHEMGHLLISELKLPVLGRDFMRVEVHSEPSPNVRHPEVTLDDLRLAWLDILQRAKLHTHHTISREELSVREHMSIVLRTLQGKRFVEFEHLFDVTRGAPVMVVTFIAMLELGKERLIEITQAEAFAPIYVRLAYEPS